MVKIYQSQGGFKKIQSEDNITFKGEVSFIFRAGRQLFAMNSNGEIVHSEHKDPSVMSIFLHKDSQDILSPYVWYSFLGRIFISKNQKTGFFLPALELGQSPPQVFVLSGNLHMPDSNLKPLFRYYQYKVVPLNLQKGLVVYLSQENYGDLKYNENYLFKACIFKPAGYSSGILSLTNFNLL